MKKLVTLVVCLLMAASAALAEGPLPEELLLPGQDRVTLADAVGMACAGVLYGYGSREELAEARADYLCATVPDLRRLLLGEL